MERGTGGLVKIPNIIKYDIFLACIHAVQSELIAVTRTIVRKTAGVINAKGWFSRTTVISLWWNYQKGFLPEVVIPQPKVPVSTVLTDFYGSVSQQQLLLLQFSRSLLLTLGWVEQNWNNTKIGSTSKKIDFNNVRKLVETVTLKDWREALQKKYPNKNKAEINKFIVDIIPLYDLGRKLRSGKFLGAY